MLFPPQIARQKEDYTAVRQRLSDKEDLIVAINSDHKRDDMIQSFAQVKAEEALDAMKVTVRELTKKLREQEQQLHQQQQQEQKMKGKMKELTKKLKDQQQQQEQLEQQLLQQQEEQQQQLTPTSTARTVANEQELKGSDAVLGKGEGLNTSAIKDSSVIEEGLEFDWNLLQGWMYVCAWIAMAHLAITVVINSMMYILSLMEGVREQDMTESTELLQQATTEKQVLQDQLVSMSKAREDAAIALHQAVKDKQMIQQQCASATKERDFLCKNNGVLQTRLTAVEGALKAEKEQHKSATAAAATKEHTDLLA